VVLLIATVITALVMCSRSLYDIYIKDIENVLVSEEEIMFDLHVHAINPNLVAIQISDLDINIFAKSKYVGTGALWRDGQDRLSSRRRQRSGLKLDDARNHTSYRAMGGVDEGNDPIEDPDSDPQTMLLGQILDFDSPLIFEASPLQRRPYSSTGEVRLAKPGNSTVEGGPDRWAKVIQHPFELIVKGVIHYSLPISSKVHSASIIGSVTVRPGTAGAGDPSDPNHFEEGAPSVGRKKLRVEFTA